MTRKNEQYKKSAPGEIANNILSVFRKSPKMPLNQKQVATSLGINNKEGLFITNKYLNSLVEKGELEE